MIRDSAWSARRVRLVAAGLILGAGVLHCAVAARRSAGLLEHDEAITLLAAAGKAEQMDRLHADPCAVGVLPAAEVQDYLRPADGSASADVFRSLALCDMHPPLYFLTLHALGRAGGDLGLAGRLFGTLVLIFGVWCANRWIWPRAAPSVKLLAAAWLLFTPTMLDIATELRQYSLVYFGVILSIAALVKLWEEPQPTRTTFALLAVAPVVLFWSQYGTALWIAFGLMLAMIGALVHRGRRWKLIAAAVGAAAVPVAPLLIWAYLTRLSSLPPPEPLANAWHGVFLPVCRAVAGAWWDVPWRWPGEFVMPASTAVILLAALVLAWAGGRRIDRWLLMGTVAWAFVWLLLLQGGWVPPHAVEAKHLGPLVLVPVLVIARAGSARSQAVRIAAAVVLAVSLLAQTPRSYRALCRSSDERLIASLRGAECLWVDTPRRGYLLPLVDKLPPDAQVVIAGPDLVRERREELDKLLPRSRLMYAEINEYPGQQRSPVQQEVVDRFSELYEAREVLKQGPRRTVTEFSRKRTATSSSPAE